MIRERVQTVEKPAYYRSAGMPAQLARRYFRIFGEARRILDLGCGTGELGRHRPNPDVEIVGVDSDGLALSLAQERETTLKLDLDDGGLPFGDASFDAVLAKDILEHVDDPGAITREIRRVLRPGGVVVVSVPMAKPRVVWNDYTHIRGFTKRAVQMMLEDAGLEVDAIWRMGGVPLANRLRFMWLVPYLLRLPIFSQLWASSWELQARRALR